MARGIVRPGRSFFRESGRKNRVRAGESGAKGSSPGLAPVQMDLAIARSQPVHPAEPSSVMDPERPMEPRTPSSGRQRPLLHPSWKSHSRAQGGTLNNSVSFRVINPTVAEGQTPYGAPDALVRESVPHRRILHIVESPLVRYTSR